MGTRVQTLIEFALEEMSPSPDVHNAAVTRCCNAWLAAHQLALARGINPVSARLRGNEAFRRAMPPLAGTENILDYIACVAHGMASRTIVIPLGQALLSAARASLMGHKPSNMKGLRRNPVVKNMGSPVKEHLTPEESIA